MKTIFEMIIDGELPCDKVFENEHVIAFKDIHPKAPIHILIVTKKPISNLQSLPREEYFLLGEIAKVAQHLAEKLGVSKTGYRLLANVGPHAGQSVDHLHFHFLAGGPLVAMG